MEACAATVLQPQAGAEFVETNTIKDLLRRALVYLRAGFPVHFRGASGTGKTTLALRLAELLRKPVLMLHGDEQLTTSDLVGAESGYHLRRLRDNFISSVLKIEEDGSKKWVDNRLTLAVEHGYTLIYDEFTRSRPEANNILLSVLQEGILDLPSNRDSGNGGFLKVHPDFRAIFTSNPEEYAGVHRSQDALRDRMVTLDLEPMDEGTEIHITSSRSGLPPAEAGKVVRIVRHLREHGKYEFAPTIRGCIMIARTVREYGKEAAVRADNPLFRRICLDVLASETSRVGSKITSARVREVVLAAIDQCCGRGAFRNERN